VVKRKSLNNCVDTLSIRFATKEATQLQNSLLKGASEQRRLRGTIESQTRFFRTLRPVSLRLVHDRTHGVNSHEPRTERLEQVGDLCRIGNTWVKPQVIVALIKNYRHSIMNVLEQRVRFSRQNRAGFDDFGCRSFHLSHNPANANRSCRRLRGGMLHRLKRSQRSARTHVSQSASLP
jgi:hypothetical protein